MILYTNSSLPAYERKNALVNIRSHILKTMTRHAQIQCSYPMLLFSNTATLVLMGV